LYSLPFFNLIIVAPFSLDKLHPENCTSLHFQSLKAFSTSSSRDSNQLKYNDHSKSANIAATSFDIFFNQCRFIIVLHASFSFCTISLAFASSISDNKLISCSYSCISDGVCGAVSVIAEDHVIGACIA
jgi:hypothetical protein